MNIDAEIETRLENRNLNIELKGTEMALLIGRRGQTLDSLQYLVSLVVNKENPDYIRIILDTENYREKREETLKKLAHKLAYKAKKISKRYYFRTNEPL